MIKKNIKRRRRQDCSKTELEKKRTVKATLQFPQSKSKSRSRPIHPKKQKTPAFFAV